MLKKSLKMAVALLAIVCLAGCSLLQVDQSRIIIANVGGDEISLTDYLAAVIPYFNQYEVNPHDTTQKELITSIEDACIEMLIMEKITALKLVEYGVTEEPEDRQAAEAETKYNYDSTYESFYGVYMNNYPDATDEEARTASQDYVDSFFDHTYTFEDYIEETVQRVLTNKLIDTVTAGLEVSEDELQAQFNTGIEAAKAEAEKGLASYVSYMENTTPYYTPDGFYYVKHILITVDEETGEEVQTLRGEGLNDEADAVLAEGLKGIQARADEALAKVNAGEDFDALIEQYGDDPGMQVEPSKTIGYIMYEGNQSYVQGFYDAAVLLAEDGATSGLAATDFGYHIIKRVSTIPAGPIDYEAIRDELYDTVYSQKRANSYQAQIAIWKEEYGVKISKNKITYPK